MSKLLDQLAVRLLLENDQRGLERLSRAVRDAIECRYPCPACGSREPKEDNGLRPSDPNYTLLCACGEQFEP